MKVLLPLLIVVIIALFFLGLFAPRRSRRAEETVENKGTKAEGRLRRKDSGIAKITAWWVRFARRASRGSARLGRKLRGKLTATPQRRHG